ncbi:hypothetical protein DL96DRAFT_1706751 [Flagelloscypha sp. PMI_526]|nr:hypothetical protein DL96DRAFT_1706751 [Flagelloscypha sp. PMI_526]
MTLAPSAVAGGINFAIAHLMYHKMDLIRFWPFPNTIAGDLVVTTFIQGTITYLTFGATLSADIRRGSHVPWPLPPHPLYPPESLLKKYPQLTPRPPSYHDIFDFDHFTFSCLRKRLFNIILKGIICSFCLCLILWPISVAILAPRYGGGRNMSGTYTPQVIKAVYGFVLSAIQTPIVAFIIMNGLAVERDSLLMVERDEKASNRTSGSQESLVAGDPLVIPAIPPSARTNSLPTRGRVVGTYRQRSQTISFGAYDEKEAEQGRIVAPSEMRRVDKIFTVQST